MFSHDTVTNIYLTVALLGVLTLALWMLKSIFVGFVLHRHGVTSQATVQRCVEVRMRGGSYYVVFYAFNIADRNGISHRYSGFHRSAIALKQKDIVAIQYWYRFPSVSRMYDRTI
jgi:hypothetical protein